MSSESAVFTAAMKTSASDVGAKSLDVIKTLEAFVTEQLHWLRPVSECWQPTDFLPDATSNDWPDAVQACRRQAQGLSDELLVVLVGDMITEEALPSYQTWLNRVGGIADPTGTSESPWAQWTRGWTAEENRHGDLLNRYLYLSGRVEMRSIERTIQHLLRNGFDPRISHDPYQGLIYTSFQERGTKISHGNMGSLASLTGDATLARICNTIAGDEARHEEAYKRFVGRIFELDPAGAVNAFAALMRVRVVMPAKLMTDGQTTDLFEKFTAVAEQVGVYTIRDYAENIEHLVQYWRVPRLTGLHGEAQEAQEYLCRLGRRYRHVAERMGGECHRRSRTTFSWIFGRTA